MRITPTLGPSLSVVEGWLPYSDPSIGKVMMETCLAIIYHDPGGVLYDQIGRVLPRLCTLFPVICVAASPVAHPESLQRFSEGGAQVRQLSPSPDGQASRVGQARRATLQLGLNTGLPFILYLDGDVSLHWVERYPDELAQVKQAIQDWDFTILGRTRRAWEARPATMRQPEAIVNQVYALVSGQHWDAQAGARGLSRQAAQAILAGCPDEEISTDVTWPLFIQKRTELSLGYLAVDGPDYETAEKFRQAVQAAGGAAQWMAALEQDPHEWYRRMKLACLEIEAMMEYV